MSERRLVVVSAGLGQPSSTRLLADRLAAATVARLAEQGLDTTVDVVELRAWARPLVDHLLTGFPAADLRATIDRVLAADGLVVATPVFNGSYSGLFKLFFDVLELDSLTGVPVLLAATGGTPRHSLVIDHALRPLFSYLGAVVMPTGVFAASDDWGASGGAAAALGARIERAGAELGDAMARARRRPVADPFDSPPDFVSLLDEGRRSPDAPS